MKERLIWVDWMKVVGMYFIIVGHFFPLGNECIYMFSVPLFFFISGFLTKLTDLCYKKLYSNLIQPLLLICLTLYLIHIITIMWSSKTITPPFHLYEYWKSVFIGNQGENIGGGLGACWFIYTLILVKIVAHYTKSFSWIVFVLFCGIAYYLNYKKEYLYSSWANVILAYPFFATGVWAQRNNILNLISSYIKRWHIVFLVLLFFGISILNGRPMMYRNDYGNDFFLSYFGGMLGILLIYTLCAKLEHINSKIICVVSNGSIIILGFHGLFIRAFYELNKCIHLYLPVTAYFFSVIILLLFYPIIIFFEKNLPIFLGKRRIS